MTCASGNWVSQEMGQRYFICSENSRSFQTQWLRRIFQEEQMGACEYEGFRYSGEGDVLAKPPSGVCLVQAQTTYSMRWLDEA